MKLPDYDNDYDKNKDKNYDSDNDGTLFCSSSSFGSDTRLIKSQ